jgi:8-oxo-dGTP pyrophosphatase MutT (NUDIX family)
MEKEIAKRLASRKRKEIEDEKQSPSAVLLLLLEKDGEYHIVFTRRSENVEYHKGEISLPGGRVHPEDSDLLDTALREGTEEIGLVRDDVMILGGLDDTLTVSTGFVITPFVGVVSYPYPFQIDTDEVAELILVPLRALMDERCVRTSQLTWDGKQITTYHFDYHGDIIWGATARIVKQFLDLTMGTTGSGDRDNGTRESTSSCSKDSKVSRNAVPWAKDEVPRP